MASQGAAVAALIAVLALSGCSSVPSGGDESPSSGSPSSESAVDAAAALITERYELVRNGDFESACGLYSEEFTALFIELVGTGAQDCVTAHQDAAAGVEKYLATAQEQDRAGLTPFFFVPSEIEVALEPITSEADDVAFLGEGTVVSLDPREFEDGAAMTPGWLAGQLYVNKADDGDWRFIAPTEQ